MSIDPYYVLFTVAKFSAWGEIVDLAEGIYAEDSIFHMKKERKAGARSDRRISVCGKKKNRMSHSVKSPMKVLF